MPIDRSSKGIVDYLQHGRLRDDKRDLSENHSGFRCAAPPAAPWLLAACLCAPGVPHPEDPEADQPAELGEEEVERRLHGFDFMLGRWINHGEDALRLAASRAIESIGER